MQLEQCAIQMLDKQSLAGGMHSAGKARTAKREADAKGMFGMPGDGHRLGDSGGASRFFFQAKHDKDDVWQNQESATNYANFEEQDILSKLIQLRDSALSAAVTKLTDSKKEELQVLAASIGNFKNFIQIQSLVSLVVNSDNTDTTEITQNLWKLSGCAHLAIEESIKQENQRSESDQVKATRFLYCAKVSPSERNAGLEDMPDKILAMSGGAAAAAARGETEYTGTNTHSGYDKIRNVKNNHPTVKPLRLMRYLCKLITPPNGIVLDPFMGSGSTGLAAKQEGFEFVGIEREKEYFEIAAKRIGISNEVITHKSVHAVCDHSGS